MKYASLIGIDRDECAHWFFGRIRTRLNNFRIPIGETVIFTFERRIPLNNNNISSKSISLNSSPLKKIFLPQDLLEEFSAPNSPSSTTTMNHIILEQPQLEVQHVLEQSQLEVQQRNWKENVMFYEEKDDEDGIYIIYICVYYVSIQYRTIMYIYKYIIMKIIKVFSIYCYMYIILYSIYD